MDTPVTEPPTTRVASAEGPRQRALNERRISIVGHLEELRKRVWGCVAVIILASMVSFAWTDQLVEWLKRPAGPALQRFAFFSPPEAFLAYMKVAITVGLFLSAPVILAQVWAFISPGLTARERRYGFGFIWCGSALFVAGGAFAYWVLLPVSLRFLLNFGHGQMEPVMSVSRYLSFTTMVILSCGAAFQLPLVMFVLARLGLVSAHLLRQKWRHAVIAIVVAAAILTPTADVATLLLLAVPMLALYELSIWVTGFSASRRISNG
jgi:sec-independent protein translocase protein TatC